MLRQNTGHCATVIGKVEDANFFTTFDYTVQGQQPQNSRQEAARPLRRAAATSSQAVTATEAAGGAATPLICLRFALELRRSSASADEKLDQIQQGEMENAHEPMHKEIAQETVLQPAVPALLHTEGALQIVEWKRACYAEECALQADSVAGRR